MTQTVQAPPGAATVPPRVRRGRVKQPRVRTGVNARSNVMAYAMLAPIVLLLTIFVVWPVIYAIYLSFYNWSFYTPPIPVGWRNYVNVLGDRTFIQSVGRGLLFAVIVVPVQLIIGFLFASLVKSVSGKLATVLKVSIYIPTIISGVIASIVFVLIYNYQGGILNAFVGLFGIEKQAWLGNAETALGALTVPAIWLGLGIGTLIMLAGMVDIPPSYYEAADLDGATWFQKTFYITIPLMRNIFLYLLIAGFTAAVQQFELPLVMTDGGPLERTLLPNLYIFQHFRNDTYVGYSIAAAILLMIVLGSISAGIFRVLNSEKAVDG
ncbi:carbohydrate ABC transporter permease [Pseudactinotalea terrae]|uniref:carbohydrate ABC transporter permease n=1 Tax=Pseudactinotalea terrae TaxID=1743262 RepID=UPI0012E1AF0E|nr:sugar ABC transporter permease [Pseudactinotalea terrae]